MLFWLGDPKKRRYGLSAGEKRRDHIQSRIEGKSNSLKRYLCSTVNDDYKKERLQVLKESNWTEARRAQERRKKNFSALLVKLIPSTLEDLVGVNMAVKLPEATASRSVVEIIETARHICAAEAIANGQILLHEEPSDANEVPMTTQLLTPVARVMLFVPISGNKRKADIAELPILEGEPFAKKRNEIVDLCEKD